MKPNCVALLFGIFVLSGFTHAEFIAGQEEKKVTPTPLNISGKVYDSQTQEPVPEFDVFIGRRQKGEFEVKWSPLQCETAREGILEIILSELGPYFLLRVEAKGYVPSYTESLSPNTNHNDLEFRLEKRRELSGIIVGEDGEAISDASVTLDILSSSNGKMIINGVPNEPWTQSTVSTDAQGRFSIRPFTDEEYRSVWSRIDNGQYMGVAVDKRNPEPVFSLYVMHPSGFLKLDNESFPKDENRIITLKPWGRIEGRVFVGSEPEKNVPVELLFRSLPFRYQTTSDEQGRFVFEKVSHGVCDVFRFLPYTHDDGRVTPYPSHGVKIQVQPGKHAPVQIGGSGRAVIGKLDFPKESGLEADWTGRFAMVTPSLDEINKESWRLHNEWDAFLRTSVPQEYRNYSDNGKTEEEKKEYELWLKTETGQRFLQLREGLEKHDQVHVETRMDAYSQDRFGPVDRDGRFRIDDVPPGAYRFVIGANVSRPEWEVHEKLEAYTWKIFAIPESNDDSEKIFDLGTVEIGCSRPDLIPMNLGETAPDFMLKPLLSEGESEQADMVRLPDYRGKTVILAFWASWHKNGPDFAFMTREVYEKEIKDDENIVLFGINVDQHEKAAWDFLALNEMPWPQLHTEPFGAMRRDFGVQKLPWVIAVDPEGKVIFSNPFLENVRQLRKKD